MITLKAPAKINLFLRLTGKRTDGYNNINTVFQRLALHDTLSFKRITKPEIVFHCSHPGVPRNKTNLIHKAFYMMQERFNLPGGLDIRLEKKIPLKAGLGGASSDAAATIIAINRLWNIKLNKYALCDLGKVLGADVPFFLTGDSLAFGVERGDKIIRLPSKKQRLYFVLFVFKSGLKTKAVYEKFSYRRQPRMSLTNIQHTVIMLPLFLGKKDVSAISRITYNDLLIPASELKPHIAQLLQQLKNKGVQAAHMTGSGATIYAVCTNRKEAMQLANADISYKNVTPIITYSY